MKRLYLYNLFYFYDQKLFIEFTAMNKTIQFQDKTIAFSVTGKGPALVLLHGFLESKAIWKDFAETLEKEFTIVVIDLPGHGESNSLAETHPLPLMAAVVKAILDQENISQAVMAGHSMGGYVALQFAADYEEMLKGLALFHSHGYADSDQARENRRRTIEIVRKNRGGFIKQFIPDLFDQRYVGKYSDTIRKLQNIASGMTSEAIIAALAGMRDRQSQAPFLALTQIPVLFIIGKQDSRMPAQMVLEQAMLPQHSEILLLEGVGHMGFIEAPAITLKALKCFAKRCRETE
jgi:pimeloyl-ACP methyl ester carboxylesterase